MTDEELVEEEVVSTTMVVLDPEQWSYVRDSGKFWKIIAIVSMLLAGISVGTLIVDRIFDQFRDDHLIALAEDNHKALDILERVSSPEAEAAQQAKINNALIVVKCDTRQAMQDLVNQLVDQKLIEPVTVTC